MPRRLYPLLLLATLTAAPLARAQQATPPGGFTPDQRREIVAIVRSALVSDPSILRDAVVSLQQDQQAKARDKSAQAISADHAEIFEAPGDPVAGNPHGRLTLVEFFDVRCPYCKRMLPVIETLLQSDRDVRLILKDLPVLGPQSVLGAKALLAAQLQGGYLKMQTALMGNGVTVDLPTIQRAAEQAGLDWPKMKLAMDTPTIQARITINTRLASALGIDGTPAFVMGGQLISGAMTLDGLKAAVADLRSAAKPPASRSAPG